MVAEDVKKRKKKKRPPPSSPPISSSSPPRISLKTRVPPLNMDEKYAELLSLTAEYVDGELGTTDFAQTFLEEWTQQQRANDSSAHESLGAPVVVESAVREEEHASTKLIAEDRDDAGLDLGVGDAPSSTTPSLKDGQGNPRSSDSSSARAGMSRSFAMDHDDEEERLEKERVDKAKRDFLSRQKHRTALFSQPKSALLESVKNGDSDKLRSILEDGVEENVHKDVNTSGMFGLMPLHIAAGRGHTDCVRLLLSHKADVMARDRGGNTALHISAERGFVEVVQLILKHEGCDACATNVMGMTAQDVASAREVQEAFSSSSS